MIPLSNQQSMTIGTKKVGATEPTYIIAEMSANHHHDFDRAVDIVQAAAEAGADAIKLQTYTPDTITIDCDKEPFQIEGTIWDGRTLYDLYEEAYTPWEWHADLQEAAYDCGLDFFSTPFDPTAVDFLEKLEVPVYKLGSFENVDLPLIRKIAATGKPLIMSTGMATLAEIDEAVHAFRTAGGTELALLACTSSYPASPEDMHLRRIPHLSETFDVATGLSDHTLGTEIPVAAVALGARIIEKHLTLSRDDEGPDSGFSLEPREFKEMVRAVRKTEQAIGTVQYGTRGKEAESGVFRRSLFVVQDVKAGQPFTKDNVRSIRPGHGLHTRYYEEVLGKRAAKDLERGVPLEWTHVG
ncbi:pseudaminic acid synthase [Salisaeta longa]|uniref:pseudaminic acid synthase n=1 Tax=Salisaeta longa TaxID=503170 RepID=UPI00040C2CF0|nr:pseudaminic acid synthase [Salisaeta longa]